MQNLRTDLLGETHEGQLIQLEIQRNNDPEMPFRMLEYLVAITRAHRGRVPRQILLYVGPEPLTMPAAYEWESGAARYTLVDLRDLNGEALLASSEPGDNVLGLLARLQDRSRAVKLVVNRLLLLSREESTSYARALLILAGLRPGLAAEVEDAMTFEFDPAILENEVLGPVYERGMEQGMQRGVMEGERKLLQRLVEQRFGAVPSWAEARLSSLSQAEVDDLSVRILRAHSLEDLFPKQ